MSDVVTLYGIPNCDTIKKARKWLSEHSIDYSFHDYRKQGVDLDQLQVMASQLGWEVMLNRRGTTWRALSETVKRSQCTAADVEQPGHYQAPDTATGRTLAHRFQQPTVPGGL